VQQFPIRLLTFQAHESPLEVRARAHQIQGDRKHPAKKPHKQHSCQQNAEPGQCAEENTGQLG
jgi:hypothetical protein